MRNAQAADMWVSEAVIPEKGDTALRITDGFGFWHASFSVQRIGPDMFRVTGMLDVVHCYNDAIISSYLFGLSWTQHIQSFMMTCNGL